MAWARKLLGDAEIDRRYKALQKHVGRKHFHSGFTSFSQHNGSRIPRTSGELHSHHIRAQIHHSRSHACVPSNPRLHLHCSVRNSFFHNHTATRRCARPSVSTLISTIYPMQAFVMGLRRKGLFNIKKVELLHHDGRFISTVGSLMQYSAEQTERCHITMAKAPYRATNHKDHEEQVCRVLDRQEKLTLFEIYICWRLSSTPSQGEQRLFKSTVRRRQWSL